MRDRRPDTGGSEARAERFLRELHPHRASLERYARRALRDAGDAEDALQAATMWCFRDFDRFAPGSRFGAFCFRYLVHEVRNRNRKRRAVALEPAALENAAPRRLDALEQLERETTYQELLADPGRALVCFDDEVARALESLGADERTALLLRALAGLTYREIAAVLSAPVGTVMTRLHRAREKLRGRLAARALAQTRGRAAARRAIGNGGAS